MNGQQLRQWRTARGLTLRDLGMLLDVQASTILRWERDERRMPGAWLDLALKALACRAQPPEEGT